MRSIVTPQFKKMLSSLPLHIQKQAREGFEKWKQDPHLVGWKKIAGTKSNMHSVEIGNRWRAIGIASKEHNAVVWTFVGSHETYNNYINIHRSQSQENFLNASSIKEKIINNRSTQSKKSINNNCSLNL